jgi:hypothetical protein
LLPCQSNARYQNTKCRHNNNRHIKQIVLVGGNSKRALRRTVELGRSARAESKVKIRQALGRVAEAAIARRYNLTTRLHVELWGNARGV